MSKLLPTVVVAAILAAPVISFAQSSEQSLTRAQVRAELIELEHAGYKPQNPGEFQAAEGRVNAERRVGSDTSGYGAPVAGTSESGALGRAAQVTR